MSNQRNRFAVIKPNGRNYEIKKHLLDHIATQEDSVFTYDASDMKLTVHSDASYLSDPKARS